MQGSQGNPPGCRRCERAPAQLEHAEARPEPPQELREASSEDGDRHGAHLLLGGGLACQLGAGLLGGAQQGQRAEVGRQGLRHRGCRAQQLAVPCFRSDADLNATWVLSACLICKFGTLMRQEPELAPAAEPVHRWSRRVKCCLLEASPQPYLLQSGQGHQQGWLKQV